MNKILNINLGGYALTIDDDAYEYLKAYLESIRRRFSESEGRDEILSDIESRLGELISQGLGNRSIVMLFDVEAAVEIMGKPEDFGSDPVEEKKSSGRSTPPPIRPGKRLFRDVQDASVGGVCSGLAAYFGMTDPVWMRLIFVILTVVTGGSWIFIYLLLWVLVPPAATSADRLSMRGEPINVDNIAKEVEEGFDRFGKKVNELGKEVKQRSQSTRVMSDGVTAIGQVFGFVIRFVGKFGVLIAILVSIGLFIALVFGWVAGLVSMTTVTPFLEYASPTSAGLSWLGFANLFFLLSIPLIGLFLLFVRLLFHTRTPGWVASLLGITWVINFISGLLLLVFTASGYSQTERLVKKIDLTAVPSDTLRIEEIAFSRSNYDDHTFGIDEDIAHVDDDKLEVNGPLRIQIHSGSGSFFDCSQTIRAHGSSSSDAMDNARAVNYEPQLVGNILRVPTGYSIPKGKKWRAQEIILDLEIPVGKYVVFGKNINDRVQGYVDYAENDGEYYISDYPNRLFRMTSTGLECVDCPKFGERDYRGGRNYENFILEGNFTTDIRKGNNFEVKIDGVPNAEKLVQVLRIGDDFTITTNGKTVPEGLHVMIQTPEFTNLHTKGDGAVTIRGFDEHSAAITVNGTTKINAYFDSNNLDLSLNGKCSVELTGSGDDLNVSLTDGATIESTSFRVNNIKISASDASQARVYAKDNVRLKKDTDSKVKVEGNANIDDDNNDNGQ